jgi:cysteine-rich repeat protein
VATLGFAFGLLAAPLSSLAHPENPHVCGDGVVEAEEQCDDANLVDDDTCHDDCTLNCSAEDHPSTFAAIQTVVFEGYEKFAGDTNARIRKNEPHRFEAEDASPPGSCSAP